MVRCDQRDFGANVGDTINNKSTQKLFAGQDKRDLPKEQWYVAKDTHPAIIARLTASMVLAFIENVFVYDGGRIVVRFKYEQSIQDSVKALHTD